MLRNLIQGNPSFPFHPENTCLRKFFVSRYPDTDFTSLGTQCTIHLGIVYPVREIDTGQLFNLVLLKEEDLSTVQVILRGQKL